MNTQDIIKYLDEGDEVLETSIGSCTIRIFPYAADIPNPLLYGAVQLADGRQFDRWANSGSIQISTSVLEIEHQLEPVLAKAIEIFK